MADNYLKIKFHHVAELPTASSDIAGHVYYKTGDGVVYICTGTAFEHYGKYTAGTGITVSQGSATGNSTIALNVNGAKSALGLGSAAYTESGAYATASQGALADSAVQTVETGTTNGTIKVDGTDVAVHGLKSAAFQESSAFKTKQTAINTDPAAGDATGTVFVSSVKQDTNGVITVTRQNLPTASTTVAGITKVGASGGAAAYSHTHSYAGSSTAGGAATSANKVNSALTIGGKTFDGSAPIEVTAADLGISNSMHFVGKLDSKPTATTSDTYSNGDVILVGTKEYVRSGKSATEAGSWVELGDEGAYVTKTTAYSSSSHGVALGGTAQTPTLTVTPGSVADGNDSVVTGDAVYDAIGSAISGLTDTLTGTPGAGKTITAFDEVGGKVTATFSNISITKSQVSDFPSSMTPTSHTHGNISNDGKITATAITPAANATAANADYIILSDASDGGKLAKGIQLSNDTTKFLRADGTFVKPSYPTGFAITENLDDDDVVVLQELPAGKGNNTVNIKATHAEQGPSGGFTPTTTSTDQKPTYGGTATLNIPSVTVNSYGHVTAISNQQVKITLPASDNTDTKVTSAANHYGYTQNSGATTGSNSSTITAGTTKVITSVTLDDAKHVTGLTAATLPAYPTVNNQTVTLTYADGSTNSFTLNQSGAASVSMTDNWVEF